MITKITGETPFQVLTNNFSISPSNEGYTLQISADGVNYTNLFTVGANVTRLVTGVAANSYYRLLGNQSAVSVNWMKTCVTEGGGGDMSNYYTKDETDAAIEEALSGVTVDLSAYWTSAQTQSAITAVEDHLFDVEQVTASALTELHDGLLEVSGRTSLTSGDVQTQIDASVSGKADAAVNPPRYSSRIFPIWNDQGIITGVTGGSIVVDPMWINDKCANLLTENGAQLNFPHIYAPTTSGETGQILTPSGNTPVWITPATINGSAITAGGNIEIQAGADMSAYWTSAETQSYVEGQDFAYESDVEEIAEVTAGAINQLQSTKVGSEDIGDGAITKIVKIQQTPYDDLVNNDETDPETLYVVIPDQQ